MVLVAERLEGGPVSSRVSTFDKIQTDIARRAFRLR